MTRRASTSVGLPPHFDIFEDGSQNFIPGFARELFAAMDVDSFAVFSHDEDIQ